MSENLRNYTVALLGLERAVASVPEGTWERSTPCTEWNALQLAGHAVGVANNIAARAGVGSNIDVFTNPDAYVHDDPVGITRQTRRRLMEALDQPGALKRELTSSLGVMTVDRFLGLMLADTLIHTWDLSRAVGIDETLDPFLVRLVYDDLTTRGEDFMRGPMRYATALDDVSDADLQTRLLLFTGRTP